MREAKKVELNDWNKEVLALITEQMADVFRKGRTQDGLTCIVIDKVNILICELYISKLMMMFLNIIISLISSIKIVLIN